MMYTFHVGFTLFISVFFAVAFIIFIDGKSYNEKVAEWIFWWIGFDENMRIYRLESTLNKATFFLGQKCINW